MRMFVRMARDRRGVRLTGTDDQSVAIDDHVVLIETKTEAGDGPVDRELARMGLEPISLSKYRVGMSMVGAAGGYGAQPGSELFR